jgi:4a-hydroxytetrahydrobiopterin dehydratase
MWVGCRFMARALRSPYCICHRITPLAKSRTNYLWPANLTPYKRISNSSTMDPTFSEGEDKNKLMADVKPLLEHGWTLVKEGMGLEKTYYFKFNHKCRVRFSSRSPQLPLTSQTFYDSIGIEMDVVNHHAEVYIVSLSFRPVQIRTNGYSFCFQAFKVVRVLWTTHTPRGLSSKDIQMARYSDERAEAIGVIDKSQIKTCTSAPTSQIQGRKNGSV